MQTTADVPQSTGRLGHGSAALVNRETRPERVLVVASDHLRQHEEVVEGFRVGQIRPWGQTIVDPVSGAIRGVEFLARWERPGGKVEPPSRFLPSIRAMGLESELSGLLIRHAISFISALGDDGPFVTVNVDATEFEAEAMSPELLTAIDVSGIDAGRLVLEVTEGDDPGDTAVWLRNLATLEAMGVGLAIDDFGTGYSSLARLMSGSFSHVKLDRRLVSATADPHARSLLRAVCNYADEAGITVVAEGIETPRQRRAVTQFGAELAQGFLFSRPAPLELVYDAIMVDRVVNPPVPVSAPPTQLSLSFAS